MVHRNKLIVAPSISTKSVPRNDMKIAHLITIGIVTATTDVNSLKQK